MYIQISWLKKSTETDLDLHCLQKQGESGFRRTRIKTPLKLYNIIINRKDPDVTVIWSFVFFCICIGVFSCVSNDDNDLVFYISLNIIKSYHDNGRVIL